MAHRCLGSHLGPLRPWVPEVPWALCTWAPWAPWAHQAPYPYGPTMHQVIGSLGTSAHSPNGFFGPHGPHGHDVSHDAHGHVRRTTHDGANGRADGAFTWVDGEGVQYVVYT